MKNSLENSFVIQEHSTPEGTHWDLMLQIEDTLWTWRLHHPPQHIQDTPVPAEKIADHPLRFLSYEGSVQNHTGSVKIADRGSFTLLKQTEKEISFETAGQILKGEFQLQLQQDNFWLLSRIR
jgi:bifunctional non-homologous end joining protein LigD